MSLRQLLLTAIISSLVTALVLFSLFYFFREQLREGENLSNIIPYPYSTYHHGPVF